MKSVPFELISFDCVVRRGKALSITVPTPEGEITILPGHIPLVSVVVPGELRATLEDDHGAPVQETRVVGAGFVEVAPNGIAILCRMAELVEEIDVARAEDAIARAKQRLAEFSDEQRAVQNREFAEVDALLIHNLARLRIARRRRKG